MMPGTSDETAAAEMIGALSLLAVFIAAIAIIAVTLFSQPLPEKIPAMALTITNESRLITISHDSGDPILLQEMAIRVDDQPVLPGTWVCEICGDDFSIGDKIRIDYSGHPGFPKKVDIIAEKAGSDYRLLTTRYL